VKIIALHHNTFRNNDLCGLVVELNYSELSEIIGPACGRVLERCHVGQVIEIHDQYKHAMEVVKRIGDASKLPETLRTLAAMLELSHPALANIVEPAVEAEASA